MEGLGQLFISIFYHISSINGMQQFLNKCRNYMHVYFVINSLYVAFFKFINDIQFFIKYFYI